MKRSIYSIALGLAIIAISSCTKVDNYDGPDQTLQGTVTDNSTGQSIQGEIGDGANSTRIKLLETSWSANPTAQYLGVHQDGTYINTKIFKATYKMTAEGPFVPMVQTSPVVDQSQTVNVNGGTTTVNFSVEPLLRLAWVGQPVINADGTLSVQVKVTRGTTNALFQQAVTEIWLFVNPSQYVGNNINDANKTGKYTGDLNAAVANGTTITLTTGNGVLPAGALATGRDWYIRVGARTNYNLKQYNYTDVRKVVVP